MKQFSKILALGALLGITGCATQQTFNEARLQGSISKRDGATLNAHKVSVPSHSYTNGSFKTYPQVAYTNAPAYAAIPAWAGKVYLLDATNTLEERLDTTRHLNVRSDGYLPLEVLNDVERALPASTNQREIKFGVNGSKEYFFPKAEGFELNQRTGGDLARITAYAPTNTGVLVGIAQFKYLDQRTQEQFKYRVTIVPDQRTMKVVKKTLDVATGQEALVHAGIGGGFGGLGGAVGATAIDGALWFGAYLEGQNQVASGTAVYQNVYNLNSGLDARVAHVYNVIDNAARDGSSSIIVTPQNGVAPMVINASVRGEVSYNPTNGAVTYITDQTGAYQLVEFARYMTIGGTAHILHNNATKNPPRRQSTYGGGHTGNGPGLVPPGNQYIDQPRLLPGGAGVR